MRRANAIGRAGFDGTPPHTIVTIRLGHSATTGGALAVG